MRLCICLDDVTPPQHSVTSCADQVLITSEECLLVPLEEDTETPARYKPAAASALI